VNETWWIEPDQLDDDQQDIVSDLPIDEDHLVLGPPGSGKTNLLLLRANHLDLAGKKNIHVLVFTRTLREFIASGAHAYSFSTDKITTSTKWGFELLKQHGGKLTSVPDGFAAQREFLLERLSELIDKKNLHNVCDVLLLDESQDYWPEEIDLFTKLARRIFAVADSNQKIYGGDNPVSKLAEFATVHELHNHYRNGLNICKFADAIAAYHDDYKKLAPDCNYNEAARKSKVDLIPAASIEDQADAIVAALDVQLKAYPDELIGIMCPENDALGTVWDKVAASPYAADAVLERYKSHAALNGRRICVSTIHSAKGLEFRAGHIAGGELFRKAAGYSMRNLAFTAATRVKTSLTLYYSGSIPGWLEQAHASLQPPPEPPKLADVFGKKKK
jgi:superfamily I DNA/RNA helicase